jgi:spermidine synthase
MTTREVRTEYLRRAANLFVARLGRVVLEIGSIRCPQTALSDGHSTLVWAHCATRVYLVDSDWAAVALTRHLTMACPHVEVVCADGLDFIRAFSGPIDLLCLDAGDDPDAVKELHLAIFCAAQAHLAPESLVVIDDTDLPHAGRGELVLTRASTEGYRVLWRGRQTALSRHA